MLFQCRKGGALDQLRRLVQHGPIGANDHRATIAEAAVLVTPAHIGRDHPASGSPRAGSERLDRRFSPSLRFLWPKHHIQRAANQAGALLDQPVRDRWMIEIGANVDAEDTIAALPYGSGGACDAAVLDRVHLGITADDAGRTATTALL